MHTWFHVLSDQKILKGIYFVCTDNIFIFQIRSTTTSNRLTNSTKSRISSIFSSTVDSIGDDDPFDLKASARKLKPIRESIVNTGRLVDIDFAE